MTVKRRIERLETKTDVESNSQPFCGVAFQPDPDNADLFEVRQNGQIRQLSRDELLRLKPHKIIVGLPASSL